MDFDLERGTEILERTPPVLSTWLEGMPPEWLDSDEGPGTWSPRIVVGHLVHGERTDWISRARLIVEQAADRRFRPFDRFAQFRESPDRPIADLLVEFATLRTANLAVLRGWRLTEEQLGWRGIHPEFGEVTLRQLLATWVAHDLGHLTQIARTMARQYREAIGPWRAYLSVMRQ